MTQEAKWEESQVLEALRWKRQQLADHEAEWRKLREHSRSLTLSLITDFGYSVARASDISGHHRNTISIWLKIHNAETKSHGTSAAVTEEP